MSKLAANDPKTQALIRQRKDMEADAAYRRFRLVETENVPVSTLPAGPPEHDASMARFKLLELD
jgi:hypothetical protein